MVAETKRQRSPESLLRVNEGGLAGGPDLSCSTIVAGQPSRMARACRRTPALMARLAMWKAGDYLLPLPTLRLRARLESGGVHVHGAASRARCGQNISSTVSTSG